MLVEYISSAIPTCYITFRRHKLYKNTKYLAKFWYYCNISVCKLSGKAMLDNSLCLTIENDHINLSHIKGEAKSFQSRQIRGELGEKLSTMSFPSKEYHNRLASLDEDSFRAGNLKHVPISKTVLNQCSYDYRKSKLTGDSVINSLKILQTRYNDELSAKAAPGFIQFISICPLTVALWY